MGGRVACRSRLHPVSSPSYYRLRSRRNVGSQVQPHGASNKVLGNVGAVLGSRWVVLVRRAQHVCRSCTGRRLTIRSSRTRSEEHTSELQSLMRISYAVFCLKKKKTTN